MVDSTVTSPQQIILRHDVVEALYSTDVLLRQIEGHLRHVPDLEKIASRLNRTTTKSTAAKASLEDVVTLYQCIVSADAMVGNLSRYQGVHHGTLQSVVTEPLRVCLNDFQNFRALVERTIDLKQAEQRVYCINMSFDASLQQLALQREQVKDQIEALRTAVETELSLNARSHDKTVSLVETPEGLALRVPKKHQPAVQGHKGRGNFKTLAIKKIEFIFTVGELEQLNKKLRSAADDYEKQSSHLVVKALNVAATYCPVVERLGDILGNLDVLAAFARVALTAPCSFARPTVDTSGQKLVIEGASHALVVANSDRAFVANDLHMDREASRLHLITGPNMGGKSTYIRSIGLIALLSQIGCFVPCCRAVLPVFDAIMCRVGASDMQLKGISTFMAEMLEAACILNTATERSLVIVDELGRGTSTADGFGIAWAIAKHLSQEKRCYSLFATHFHELAALQDNVPGVRNRHATASVDSASGKLTFLYSINDGHADQSYGAHVAELAGFPPHVVSAARCRAEEFEAGCAFGRVAKKPRLHENTDAVDPLEYILKAGDDSDFVTRCQEKVLELRAQLKS